MSTRDDILTRLQGTLRRADLPFPPANPRPLSATERMTVTRAEVFVVRDGTEVYCASMQQTLMRIVGRSGITG